MHRGSSKERRRASGPSETLPLSAPPAPARYRAFTVVIEVARAGGSTQHRVVVPRLTPVRVVLRQLGLAAEGCAVLDGDRPLPLDLPLEGPRSLTVVPTFSGG